MVTDEQVRLLRQKRMNGKSQEAAAAAGWDECSDRTGLGEGSVALTDPEEAQLANSPRSIYGCLG